MKKIIFTGLILGSFCIMGVGGWLVYGSISLGNLAIDTGTPAGELPPGIPLMLFIGCMVIAGGFSSVLWSMEWWWDN